MIHTRSTAALVAVGLVISGSIVACGGDDQSPSPTTIAKALPGAPPNLIVDRDITRQPAGSPARALLQWAQALQFGDRKGVGDLTSNAAIKRLGGNARLTRAVSELGPSFARVDVVGTPASQPTTARIRASLSSFDAAGKRVQFQPTTFQMVKLDGIWKVGNLDQLAKNLQDLDRLDGTRK